MPFHIEREGKKYKVITTATGKVHGVHTSEKDALSQMRAMYANIPEARRGKK